MDFEHSDGFAKTIFSAIPTYNSREPVVVPASLKYFMELCDEVELVYQRLRVFSGSKKRLPTGGCRGLDFGFAFRGRRFSIVFRFFSPEKACTPAPCPAGLDIVEPQAANRKRSRFDSYRITPCTAGGRVQLL